VISSEIENDIVLRRRRDCWSVGTIARYVRQHRDVVRRVLRKFELLDDGCSRSEGIVRISIVDPYLDFIKETLEEFPEICASRVYDMIRKRGYPGVSVGHIRKAVLHLRPKKEKEAFFRLAMLPGEQAQVDWADFGSVQFGKHQRKLSAFVMTLSYSRMIFLRFFYGMKMREFKQGHIEAFEFFGGVPSKILHDNLKTGVSERLGPLIRFNDQFLKFASHYAFSPRAANVRRGNEKGRVERAIQYVRTSFFEGRKWNNLSDFNSQALEWSLEVSANRPWPQDRTRKVGEVFKEEKEKLLALPAQPYPCWERLQVSIAKTPYARFDGNDYSVPTAHVQSVVEVCANETSIKIFANTEIPVQIAEHSRVYGKQMTVEDPTHLAELASRKKAAVQHSGLHKLNSEITDTEVFLARLAERGENLGGAVSSLLRMIRTHGAKMVNAAVSEVVSNGSCNLKSVHFVLARLERRGQITAYTSAPFSSDQHANLTVTHHDPKTYDQITGISNS
jgi:transposase